MHEDIQALIIAVLRRAPEWIRQDLLSKEPSARTRAEETLGAMIAGALKEVEPA